ncbi:hypothetical protein BAE44_0011942 [Dichanthelium oligosanthes]|uniref:DUF1618 domain-containing protein n=1 Tax=Dichanthelium oligosanthes TaxID=888268 RepID=A0A1E5VPI0_9POAL|nr:hypothetical protein BAE44_0011942 [Dichanthelium oligosanthes]
MAAAARAKTVAAATARSLPRWLAPHRSVPSGFVLERFVDLESPPVRLQQEWAIVNCPIKKASGCGEHGQRVVEGLTLYARLLTSPDLTSSLYIRVSDDALRGMKAEFGLGIDGDLIRIDEFRGFGAAAFVEETDEGLIFFTLVFRLREHGERKYYLVYDAVAASLSMIPYLPRECPVAYTLRPLKVPRGGGYELALLAYKPVPPTPEQMERRKEDVVCVWTPAATVEEESSWLMLGRHFPEQAIQNFFKADVMFFCRGEAFWVDLAQGLVHCDWPPADGSPVVDVHGDWPPADGGAVVDFGFIELPPGCPPDERWTKPKLELSDELDLSDRDRTMAYVAGSIRFVCIDRSRRLGNVNISVWNLDPATKVWTNYKNFLAKELWRLWTFKKDMLPEMEPRFPVLMADGTLCLLLRNKPEEMEDPAEDYICNIELPLLKVRWSGRLSQYHTCEHPIVLPFDFFGMVNPLIPRQKELRGIFTQK